MVLKTTSAVSSLGGAEEALAALELENWGRVKAQDVATDSTISATDIMEKICQKIYKQSTGINIENYHQISPGDINAYSTLEVMRIKDMITQVEFS